MRLDDARLCLDCEEIHNERECPSCGSEAFAFLKRWIKTSSAPPRGVARVERREAEAVARPAMSGEQLDAWKQIIEGKPEPQRGRLVARGLLGLAAMGLAGWAWTRAGRKSDGSGGS